MVHGLDSWVGTVDCFSPLEACMEPAGPHGGLEEAFISDLVQTLGLVSDVHGVFSNKDLSFVSRRQPRVTVIAYSFSEVS